MPEWVTRYYCTKHRRIVDVVDMDRHFMYYDCGCRSVGGMDVLVFIRLGSLVIAKKFMTIFLYPVLDDFFLIVREKHDRRV